MAGIADVMQAIQFGQQQDNQLTGQALGILDQQQALGQQIAVADQERRMLEAEASKQKLEGELAAQQAARAIADSLGANPDTQNFKLAVLGQDFWEAYNQAKAAADVVAKKNSVGFFDNPIQYIGNQLTVGQDIERYNAHATRANIAMGAMQEINAAVTGAATAQKSIAQTVTRDSIAKMMDAAALSANMAKLEADQKNLSYDMDGIRIMMAASERAIDRQFKLNSALVQQQQLAISQGHLALAQQEAKDRAAARMQQLSEKKEEEAGWDEAARTFNVGAGTLGLPPISAAELKQRLRFGGEAAKKDFEQMYSLGTTKAAGIPVIASSPGQAALTIAQKRAPLNPGMQDTKDFLMSTMQSAAQKLQALDPGKPIKQDAVVQATDADIKARTQTMLKDVTRDPFGKNIYKAPDYKTMLAIPDVANTKFAQVVIQPQIAGGGSETNPNVLIDAGLAAVNAGQLSYQEFVQGFTNYFAAAKNWNNVTKNFRAVNLPLQDSYNATVYNGTRLPFGRTNIVDLSNRAQVENFLARRRAKQLGENGGVESFFPVAP